MLKREKLKLNMQIKLEANKISTNKSSGFASFFYSENLKPTASLALY